MRVCQKSHIALIFLMFERNYPNYRKLAKTKKKTVPNTKTCVQMWQSIFSYQKKKSISQKNCNFFLWKKEICEEKSSFIFLTVLTHNFERIHHETNWLDSGLGGLFYFILFLIWSSVKNIINFQLTIYMCIPLFLCLIRVNIPWWDGWMIGQMWSIISSICLVIAGLWHVCHLFLLLSSLRCVCIPLFFRPVEVNRPWRNGWMIGWIWSIISSICLVIAGLWHVCHLFLLLFPLRRICIPLFLCPVRVNRPWRDEWMMEWMDRWMTGQMDEMMLPNVLYYM